MENLKQCIEDLKDELKVAWEKIKSELFYHDEQDYLTQMRVLNVTIVISSGRERSH